MFIRNITLENFRSCKDRVLIPGLSKVNIFIGPNAAGKSNIIEAMKYLKQLLTGNPNRAFTDNAFDRNPDAQIEISLTYELFTQHRNKLIDNIFKDNPNVPNENVKSSSFLKNLTHSIIIKKIGIIKEEVRTPNILNGNLEIYSRDFTKSRYTFLGRSANQTLPNKNINPVGRAVDNKKTDFQILKTGKIDSQNTKKLLDAVRSYINSWEFFGTERKITASMALGEEKFLLTDGSNLTKFLNTLQSNNPRKLINFVDRVRRIMPSITDILSPLSGSNAVLNVREKGLDTPTDANNISSGLTQAAVLAFGIITRKKDTLIAIEEPELHLHASFQRKLFELIREESNSKQFFITSHSTIFTSCNNDNCTYLITKPNGASKVTKIQTPKQLRMVKGVLGHRNTDFYGDECVVFIEGESEEVAFPIISESLGYDLTAKGITLVNIKGSGKATKLEEYLRYLKDSDTTPYVILDGNKEIKEKLQDWERDGLIQKGNWTVWDLEFEDCFTLDVIVEAMNDVIKEQGAKFQLTYQQLEKEGKQGKSVVKSLQKILYENKLRSLDKPALAEKIAYLLGKDMQTKNHIPTPPEIEIKKVVELAKSKYD